MEILEIVLIITNILVTLSNIGIIILFIIGKSLRKKQFQIMRIQEAFDKGIPITEILKMPMPKSLYKKLYEAYQRDLWEQENCPFEELRK